MIRYRLWVWVLCLVFPTWVWAENTTHTCASFTQENGVVSFTLPSLKYWTMIVVE